MHAFRIILHVSYKATQALSNDLQSTLIQSLVTEIQPFFRWHYLHFWNNWLFAKLCTNPISAEIREFRIILHAPCREIHVLSNDLQSTLIESLITEIQSFSRGHYLHFWNNWLFAKLCTNPISVAMRALRNILHVSSRATQALSIDLQSTLIQLLVMGIQPFSREHYLHFWNNWFFAKLVTNPMSAAMPEFRMIAQASCRATQALSNDLQFTLI